MVKKRKKEPKAPKKKSTKKGGETKMIKVDQSTRAGAIVEPGFYKFKVSGWKIADSKSSDAKNAFMTSIVTEGDNEEMLGQKVVDNFPLQENSVWRADVFYQACMGEPIPDGDYSEEDLFAILQDTIGTDFGAEAIIDTYQGTKRNRLQNFSA